MEKRGATGWTVSKLLNYILLVILLIIIIAGASSGLWGLWDKVEVRTNEVVLLLKNVGSGDGLGGECLREPVNSYSGGSVFLESLKLGDEDFRNSIMQVCDNGVCTLEIEGYEDYRLNHGVFEKLGGNSPNIFYLSSDYARTYYRFNDGVWEWAAPDVTFNWQGLEDETANTGIYEGQSPEGDHLVALRGLKSKGLVDGREFISSLGGSSRYKEGATWAPYGVFIEGSLEKSRLHHELYHNTLNLLDSNGLKSSYEGMVPGEFVLYGEMKFPLDAAGNRIFAYWESGHWAVMDGHFIVYFGNDDSMAIDTFYDLAEGFNDYQVYYGSSIPQIIDPSLFPDLDLRGVDTINGINDLEIDSGEELAELKRYFKRIKDSHLEDGKPSSSEMESFLNLDGSVVAAGGKEFSVGVTESLGRPLISLFSGSDNFELIFNPSPNIYTEFTEDGEIKQVGKFRYGVLIEDLDNYLRENGGYSLRHYPGHFINSGGGIVGDSNTYKLEGDKYGEVYRGTLSSKFLTDKCG